MLAILSQVPFKYLSYLDPVWFFSLSFGVLLVFLSFSARKLKGLNSHRANSITQKRSVRGTPKVDDPFLIETIRLMIPSS